MNSDTVELAVHLATDTGAILSCPVCGHHDLRVMMTMQNARPTLELLKRGRMPIEVSG